jgi:hypothetical protein
MESVVNSTERYSDRYTPIRESPNWDIRFTMIQVCHQYMAHQYVTYDILYAFVC